MSNNRLSALEQKRAQLDAQIKALKARERQQVRKDETRRKILVGALAREHATTFPDSDFAAVLNGLLNEHVTRPQDRNLLGLDPLPEPSASSARADPHIPANESTRADTASRSTGGGMSIPWPNRSGG